jgi:hypothetical protein
MLLAPLQMPLLQHSSQKGIQHFSEQSNHLLPSNLAFQQTALRCSTGTADLAASLSLKVSHRPTLLRCMLFRQALALV